MVDALGWVGAAGGLAGFTSLGVTLHQQRKRKYVPDRELRNVLEDLDADFNDIVANGGKPTHWFYKEDRRRLLARLASLNGAVVDDALNDAIGAARSAHHDCFTLSSSTQKEKQRDAAIAGHASVVKAIERFNFLTRKYGHL
jgi:hypothetical protein